MAGNQCQDKQLLEEDTMCTKLLLSRQGKSDSRIVISKTAANMEKHAADDKDMLLRVQTARMPLMYAQLQLGVGDRKTRSMIADKLFNLTEHIGLLMFNEWNLPTEKYKAQVMEALAKEI